ncbi:phasin family protein [Hamadaea tsunoensis]|uniref:phasin family protein n=1 Tax=Hamadaea tsunoensis TaxID=53368 RepID=UPI0007E8D3A7|nr:phasin family protein [Hamadaea tsunoensis]
MADAWRSYLELAYGLTKTSQKKAQKAVKELVGKSGTKAGELQTMAEDLMATGLANRDAITTLVREELDRALNRVGLAKADELKALKKRVAELETKLSAAESAAADPTGEALLDAPAGVPALDVAAPAIGIAPVSPASKATPPTEPDATKTAAKTAVKTVAKKAVAKKTVAPAKAPAKAAPAKTAKAAPAKAEPAAPAAKAAPAKAAPAKTTPAKAPARKAVAKKAPAKKATGPGSAQ